MADQTDERLRESARHRGLRLLKSRRRKPGGDFGLYGLADAAGTPMFGVGDDGLTATAAEVAAYLRKGDAATWASSVDATPEPEPMPRAASDAAAEPDLAIRPRRGRRAEPKSDTAPARPPRSDSKRRAESQRAPTPEPPDEARQVRSRAAPPPAPASPPKPDLVIRPATRADAAAVATLIPGTDKVAIAERLAAATALGEAVFVADEGSVIGCLAWHVVPTLQHGPIARITFLAVAPDHQRRGIGRRLVDALADTATARDLPLIEAISDITIESAHGFFRRLGFTQTSYRFTRANPADKRASDL